MKSNRRIKLNNRGASLVMVIVAMLFIGIIASVVIVATRNNFLNIASEAASSRNFYTAEEAVDDLKTKFEEYGNEALKTSYASWLQQYTYMSRSEQEEYFKTMFITEFEAQMRLELFGAAGTSLVALDTILGDGFTPENVAWVEDPVIVNRGRELAVTVSIKYTDPDGTSSVISTDLVFTIEDPDFQISTTAGLNENCADYAIIADQTITNKNAGSYINLTGNLYGGGFDPLTRDYTGDGYYFTNADGNILINSDIMTTRSTLRVEDGAQVTIKGGDPTAELLGRPNYGEVWAQNFELAGSSVPTLNMQGTCYVRDDLTLEADRATFRMLGAGSQFIGYSANEVSGKPENSSAIIINGKAPTLDLSQAGRVVIAGKSFISVPAQFGYKEVYDTLLQGESIAYIGQQAAYMLPSECIIGVGHNPMTAEDFAKLADTDGKRVLVSAAEASAAGKSSYVDITQSGQHGGVALERFLQTANPVKVMHVNYSGVDMVYLYLNFRSSDSASDYFAEFARYYQALVSGRMATFAGTIKINPSTITSTGNLISTESTSDVVVTPEPTPSVSPAPGVSVTPGAEPTPVVSHQLVTGANATSGSSSLVMDQWRRDTEFSGLTSSLSKSYMGQGSQLFLTDNVVNMYLVPSGTLNISAELGPMDESFLGYFNRGIERNCPYYLYTGSDITINTNTSGIIISSGDVTINSCTFNGLIVARGNVSLKGSAKVNADKDNILYILRDTSNKANALFAVQSTATGTGSGGTIIASDLINVEYKNWKKN